MGLFERISSSLSRGSDSPPSPRTDDLDNCPYCGAGLVGFSCESCAVDFVFENDEMVEVALSSGGTRPEKRCTSCDIPIGSGGEFVSAWEDGNNEEPYVKCPHCGFKDVF